MKKTFAVIMLVTMLFLVGCGNQAKDAAKDAQQKVEQKADEVKADTAKKAEEVKADTDAKVDEVKNAASQVADDTAEKLEDVTAEITGRTIALSGVMPGASLDDLTAMFGEATKVEGDVMTFVDGLTVKLDNVTKKVKEISTTSADFDTPEGMYVGADEYLLNDYCGQADTVRKIDNGAEYEYNSGDKKSKVVYKAQNGVITEIICSLK